jgi:hypothetical protein
MQKKERGKLRFAPLLFHVPTATLNPSLRRRTLELQMLFPPAEEFRGCLHIAQTVVRDLLKSFFSK